MVYFWNDVVNVKFFSHFLEKLLLHVVHNGVNELRFVGWANISLHGWATNTLLVLGGDALVTVLSITISL